MKISRREWLRRVAGPGALLLLSACAPGGPTTATPPAAPTGAARPATPTPIPSPTPAPTPLEVANRYARAWEAGDYAAMYRLLTPAARAATPEADFVGRYRAIAAGVGIRQVRVQVAAPVREPSGSTLDLGLSVSIQTGRFGEIRQENALPLERGPEGWGVAWRPALIFKELGPGQFVRVRPDDPVRGPILDRRGRPLAQAGEVAQVGVVPGELKDEAAAAQALAKLLGGSPDAIRRRWADARPDWWVPLRDLPLGEEARAQEALKDLPGVEVRRRPARVYPNGPLAAHLLGYLGAATAEDLRRLADRGYEADDQVGQAGLEAWAETALAGRRGGRLLVVDDRETPVATIAERRAVPGATLRLTLDLDVQRLAEEELGDRRGGVVVLDVGENAVLALASRPTFDPNAFVVGISQEEWDRLNGDPGQPFLDRSAGVARPIGSIFKVVTMAAALRRGIVQPESRFRCTGSWDGLGGGVVLRDWLPQGHGNLNLVQGLSASCNIVFYTLGKALYEADPGLLSGTAEQFGFGKPSGLGVLPEAAGQVPRADSPAASVNLAIGQGEFLGTPLQVANLFAALARGGQLLWPRLVASLEGADDPKPPPAGSVGQLPIGPGERGPLIAGLRGVLKPPFGSASSAFNGFPHDVAAKTGSAESGQPELDYLWFAAFAPVDAPRFALAVMVEDSGLSSQVVAPIGRKLLEYLLSR